MLYRVIYYCKNSFFYFLAKNKVKMKNNQRKQLIDSVIQLSVKKQWCEADELFDKYLKQCYEL